MKVDPKTVVFVLDMISVLALAAGELVRKTYCETSSCE